MVLVASVVVQWPWERFKGISIFFPPSQLVVMYFALSVFSAELCVFIPALFPTWAFSAPQTKGFGGAFTSIIKYFIIESLHKHRDGILHSVQAPCSHGMQDDRSGTFKNNLFICRNFITKMLTKYELFHSPFLLPATSFSGCFCFC